RSAARCSAWHASTAAAVWRSARSDSRGTAAPQPASAVSSRSARKPRAARSPRTPASRPAYTSPGRASLGAPPRRPLRLAVRRAAEALDRRGQPARVLALVRGEGSSERARLAGEARGGERVEGGHEVLEVEDGVEDGDVALGVRRVRRPGVAVVVPAPAARRP